MYGGGGRELILMIRNGLKSKNKNKQITISSGKNNFE